MSNYNLVSLACGLGSIFVGTVGTSIKYVSGKHKHKKEKHHTATVSDSYQQQISQQYTSPTIKYSSRPVQEINRTQVATSPISFIGNGGVLPEE